MNKKFLLLVLLGVFFMVSIPAFYLASVGQPSLLVLFICASSFGIFLILPLVLTVYNLIYCFRDWETIKNRKTVLAVEIFTLALGIVFTLLLLLLSDIKFKADWTVTLINNQTHSPIWPPAWPALRFYLIMGILGYLVLRCVPLKKMPPLVTVLSISSMGTGMVICIFWIFQVFSIDGTECFLCLLPLNCIIIGIKIIREKAADWKKIEESEKRRFSNPFLEYLNQKMMDSATWPFQAFLLFWPIADLGLIVLSLFGQRPDNLIRAWTETSDWNLSTKISPPNVMLDDHYLCTVAAGGHKPLVKPVRMGIRHGHWIIVNRQLCIANAFEQVLEEHLPRFHGKLRNFYDTYGFPIARRIHSPYVADFVYVLMKPLEWFFLAILYLVDSRPEDRIWMQYIPPITRTNCTHIQETL